MRKKRILILIVLLLLIPIVTIFSLKSCSETKQETTKIIEPVDESDNNIVEVNAVDQTILSDQIDEYLMENNIDTDAISIYVKGFTSTEEYKFNEDTYFWGASVYKLPLAMYYYDLIKEGKYKLADSFVYREHHFEEGGSIGVNYQFGSYISLEVLLSALIVESDNSAGHILYENLGGWLEYKKLITKYSDVTYDDAYYSYDNIQNAAYLNDVLTYLYTNREHYNDLITNLTVSSPYQYLNKNLPHTFSQKYGHYGGSVNSVGIEFGDNPYSLVILTSLGDIGETHIGNIAEICHNYFTSTSASNTSK